MKLNDMRNRLRFPCTASAIAGLMLLSSGCEQKEKVLDIKGPGIDVEVNKTGTGNREIEIKSNGNQKIEIDSKK